MGQETALVDDTGSVCRSEERTPSWFSTTSLNYDTETYLTSTTSMKSIQAEFAYSSTSPYHTRYFMTDHHRYIVLPVTDEVVVSAMEVVG